MKYIQGHLVQASIAGALEKILRADTGAIASDSALSDRDANFKLEVKVEMELVPTAAVSIVNIRYKNICYVNIVLPAVDERQPLPYPEFIDLISFGLHEICHVKYSNTDAWDLTMTDFFLGADSTRKQRKFLFDLVNGLEDPRIEKCGIDNFKFSGLKGYFEGIANGVLSESGMPAPDDIKNLPFLLAIAGRGLNGYNIQMLKDFDWSKCPWAEESNIALIKSQKAKSTETVIKIALELFNSIQKYLKKEEQQKQPQESEEDQEDQEEDQEEGQESGEDEGAGDDTGDEGNKDPREQNEGAGEDLDSSEDDSEGTKEYSFDDYSNDPAREVEPSRRNDNFKQDFIDVIKSQGAIKSDYTSELREGGLV